MTTYFTRLAAGCTLAVAISLTGVSCSQTVASRALIQPTTASGQQASRLLRGEHTDRGWRFVYGYGPVGPVTCAEPPRSPTAPDDRYGVVICEADRPLSNAYFINPPAADSYAEVEDNRRLQRIAAESLVPVYEFSRP